MASLGDELLVLLGDGAGTAHDLQRRHVSALGPADRVDVTRVGWMLSRLERLGQVRAVPAAGKQRRFELTGEGVRQQRSWLLGLPDDDIRTRVLLAIEAADRDTFDEVVSVCLSRLEASRAQAGPRHDGRALSPESARADLADASLAAQVIWLHELRSRRRERDLV